MPDKFLTDEQRKYLIQRKGWTEEMVREYQRNGQIEGDKVLTDMIEELKPFETLESGVRFRDRRKAT